MEEIECMVSAPRLLLVEEGEGRFATVFQHGDGVQEQLPLTTLAKDLVAAAEIDYGSYRREIKRLREDHPLFALRLEIPIADFEDFVAEALLMPSMLQKIDPVSFFALGVLLDQALQRGRWQCAVSAGRGRRTAARAGGADPHTGVSSKHLGDDF